MVFVFWPWPSHKFRDKAVFPTQQSSHMSAEFHSYALWMEDRTVGAGILVFFLSARLLLYTILFALSTDSDKVQWLTGKQGREAAGVSKGAFMSLDARGWPWSSTKSICSSNHRHASDLFFSLY